MKYRIIRTMLEIRSFSTEWSDYQRLSNSELYGVRPSESLADGIAHKSRGQKGKLPFPFGAKSAPTLWCNLRTVLPQKDVAILI